MDKIVFTTIHNESTLDDGSEKPDEQIVGQFYKIKLLEPGTSNEYQCRLPIPTKIGEYSFTEIAKNVIFMIKKKVFGNYDLSQEIDLVT
ncbi:hypothetical protein HMPREF9466_01464 [Fusobacterium necrophorum subsp. funduliforme 1_1_36S]|nr:hypothetical protein HMPREF9466_01464 [Fusobacterium necrophorum subsp. funduliforme 1_1_36S]